MSDHAINSEESWDNPRTIASTHGEPTPNGEERIHCLLVIQGTEPGRLIELHDQPLTMGRATEADLRFRDPELSSRHCTASLVLNQVLVADLHSTNGTYIDGTRVDGTAILPPESLLQAGKQVLKHLYRGRTELEQSRDLEDDLNSAVEYVRSLLPAPLSNGPVHTDYVYTPCAQLGGDAFGYQAITDDTFAIYLLDVSGHGAGSSLHAVSVLNLLSQQLLPATDFSHPGQVLSALNRAFQMADHADKYFTIWYGIYARNSRELVYASAGHPPAILINANRSHSQALETPNPGIGLFPDATFTVQNCPVGPGDTLYLYSDGAYEIRLGDGSEWTAEALLEILLSPPIPPLPEAERIYRAVLNVAQTPALDDDCSILTARFV